MNANTRRSGDEENLTRVPVNRCEKHKLVLPDGVDCVVCPEQDFHERQAKGCGEVFLKAFLKEKVDAVGKYQTTAKIVGQEFSANWEKLLPKPKSEEGDG